MRKPTVKPLKSETGANPDEPAPPRGPRKSDEDGFVAAFAAARGTISGDIDLEA